MDEDDFYTIVELSSSLSEENPVRWVHALSLGTFKHPVFGEQVIDIDRVRRFHDSVQKRVRNIDLYVNYDHREHTGEAAGWIQSSQVRDDGLWLLVKFNADAADKVGAGGYRYFSSEFASVWEDPKTGTRHKDVIIGGALTNVPFLKDLKPLQLSEINQENDKVDRETLITLLGLSDDATDEQITEAIESLQNPSMDLSALNVTVGADGQVVVADATGNNTNEFTVEWPSNDEGEEQEQEQGVLATLSEQHPEVAALIETVGRLETAQQLSEATVRLSEVGTPSRRLSVAATESLKPLFVTLSESGQQTILTVIDSIVKGEGVVDLSEKGGRDPSTRQTTQDTTDAVALFMEKVDGIQKGDEQVTFSEAVKRASEQFPSEYTAYRNATTRNA